MSDYWRPSISEEKKQELEEFIKQHKELPFNTPKEMMVFATNKLIYEVETGEASAGKQKEQIKKILKEL